ncbi:MAG: hypothetical protein J07HB67_02589 [halophilic archaeon J07HB67]|nr:MAG: hypothetical protein J07HB67_02589 [halophilic archaeon J07HB67]
MTLAPDTEMPSVHVQSHDIDRDTRDRLGSLLLPSVLLGSMAVGFAVAEWVV